MIQLYLFSYERTIYEYFGLEIRLDEDSAFLIEEGTVPCHDTQSVEFYLILISIFCADFCLALFDIIE